MKSISIGRSSENDIVVNDKTVSSKHCKIIDHQDGRIEINDLGSTNGTFVNGKKVVSAFLDPGDEVMIGNHTLDSTSFFSQNNTRLYDQGTIVLPQQKKGNERIEGLHVHVSQDTKSKAVDSFDTIGRGVMNFSKAALYIALALIFFYVVYLIFKYLL